MKQYQVSVNGVVYEVQVEEVKEAAGSTVASTPVIASASPVMAKAPAPSAPTPAPAAVKAPAGSPGAVKAPMPGTILDVKVSKGQAVRKGDVLLILEAMKMENEIMAPADGTIQEVYTSKGSAVNSGDVLLSLQ